MLSGQKFCTECGASLVPGTRFCGQCGHTVSLSVPADQPAAVPAAVPPLPPVPEGKTILPGAERIIGIVPFVEQGLLSVVHYTLIVTQQRLIFCTWNPDTDEEMSEAEDEVMQESCNISETADEIAHFHAKDWTTGPWQRYLAEPIDRIGTSAPGSITIPFSAITDVEIICEKKNSTQDKLHIYTTDRQHEFDLMYSQGPFLFLHFQPVLGEKVIIADKLHQRSKFDRLFSGQEYK